ncbi:helicase-related protein [Salibacterium aidingense]|uniref:helicase-related protein n=1 Tax=Salibacterium aidingense TaxID=384933 RepID=UPI000424D83C|nr:helicase-related protein [Salibacterium aidingense]
MLKIRVTDEGKQVEAYVKTLLSMVAPSGEKILMGVDMAGNSSSIASIHASLYMVTYVEIIDEETGTVETYYPTRSYRKFTMQHGKVVHCFAMPREAVTADFQEELTERFKTDQEDPAFPNRVIFAKHGDIRKVAGYFIADTYGLPKTERWMKTYLDIFQSYWKDIDVTTTSLSGPWTNLKAIELEGLKESQILGKIEAAIVDGTLPVRRDHVPDALKSVQASFEEDMSTEDYLRRNANTLASKVEHHLKPLYDGRSFFRYVGETARISVPAQARAVMGSYHVLKKHNSVFNVGDMGTGKTQVSLTTAYTIAREREDSGAQDGLRSLVVAPSNVLPKWAKSEIPEILGQKESKIIKAKDLSDYVEGKRALKRKDRFLITILHNTEDAAQYINAVRNGWKTPRGTIHFVMVTTDRMKLSAQKFTFGGRWDRFLQVWRSPDTGKILQAPPEKIHKARKLKEEDAYAKWVDVVESPKQPPSEKQIQTARENGTLGTNGLPMGYVKRWKEGFRSFQENYSKEEKKDCSLARPAQKKWKEVQGSHRWMIAQMLQRMLPSHFHLGIFDEIHQMKATDSGRGAAFHKILKSCRKSMFLTGTLTNGESSSIFATLWRAFPKELIQAGFNHKTSKEAWASRYGVIERTTKTGDEKNVGSTTNRHKDKTIVKEKPGIAPQLVANHLLDKCVFVELQDLNIPLVELEEKPVIVDLDDQHRVQYKVLHEQMYETCQRMQNEIGTGAWAKFHPATLNYADQPSVPVEVVWKNKGDSEELDRVESQSFPADYLTAKERTLIGLVERELDEDRPCIIYNNYTGRSGDYRTNQRVKNTLQQQGIDAQILDESVSTEKRFEWLEKQEEAGTKVIITNMKLVEVGLDLVNFNTIIYFQLCDEVSTLRQSSRRGWRIGASKKCKVIYLVNNGTQQMSQFKRLMSRRISAMITEGRIERSDSLAQYADAGAGQLTNDLSKELASSDLTAAWEDLAQKDIDDNIEIVKEDEFKDAITKAFEKLTAETKELCGIDTNEAVKEWIEEGMDITEENLEEILALFESIDEENVETEREVVSTQPGNPRYDENHDMVTHLVELNNPESQDSLIEAAKEEQLSLFAMA